MYQMYIIFVKGHLELILFKGIVFFFIEQKYGAKNNILISLII